MSSSHENYSPQVIQRLSREIQDLVRSPPEGISYVPNDEDSITEIHCDLAGPVGTPYENGLFRMKLLLSKDYPHSPPRGFFLTKIFHPNVSTSGDICVNMLKRDWNADITLHHVCQVIRCLLIVPFPESSLNDEAAKLFMESYEEYARRARIMTSVHAIHITACGLKVPASKVITSGGAASSVVEGKGEAPGTGTPPPATTKAISHQRDRSKEQRRKGLKRL